MFRTVLMNTIIFVQWTMVNILFLLSGFWELTQLCWKSTFWYVLDFSKEERCQGRQLSSYLTCCNLESAEILTFDSPLRVGHSRSLNRAGWPAGLPVRGSLSSSHQGGFQLDSRCCQPTLGTRDTSLGTWRQPHLTECWLVCRNMDASSAWWI